MISEAAKIGDSVMHQYGLAALGLVICVVMMFMFVWMGLKVVVPVANAIATWSGNNAQAAASNAVAANANERISERLKDLYEMIQNDRNEELRDLGKRGQRLAAIDEGRPGSRASGT